MHRFCTGRGFALGCILVLCNTANAQLTRLHGFIKDKDIPLEFATVSLFHLPDTLHALQHVTTDSTGAYTFPVLKVGITTLAQD